MPDSVKTFLSHASYEKVETGNVVSTSDENDVIEAIINKQDCILFGPPGTSKTYMIDRIHEYLGDKTGLVKIVQFHANYTYEEFIEGIVPDTDKGGFKIEPGVFYKFCEDAKKLKEESPDKICVFVIDEINRANVTAVFGEILNLMEDKGVRKMETPKLHKEFWIPDNVVIVGTMNTADKTLAKLDFAFRRRFRFLPVFPSKVILHKMISANGFDSEAKLTVDEYVTCFEVLNTKIARHPLLGKNLTLGHVLWTKKNDNTPYTKKDIGRIFRETIFAQIESYCGSNKDALGNLLGIEIRDKILYGYEISDEEIISYLNGLKNSKVVNA